MLHSPLVTQLHVIACVFVSSPAVSCYIPQAVYGDNVDVARFQAQPRTPAQQIMDRLKELEARRAELEAELAAADNEYLKAVAAKKQKGGLTGWR